jgi:hypothetical protein
MVDVIKIKRAKYPYSAGKYANELLMVASFRKSGVMLTEVSSTGASISRQGA